MNKKIVGLLICMFFIATSTVPISVKSDIITINENNIEKTDTITLYPSEDVRINQRHPNDNFGLTSLWISNKYGATSSDWEQDILIKFDLSSIPNSASIISASLHIYYYDYKDTNPVGRPITCYRITSSWNEMEVTWNTRPSYYSSFTSIAHVPSTWGWMSWDVKNDVSDFVSGSKTNYGWQLMDETYWGYFDIPQQLYKSREDSPKPYLEIESNNPPDKPSKPVGRINGKNGILYSYKTSTTDPDGEQVYYLWDWGDDSFSQWLGPYDSGMLADASHSWAEGSYNIRVKARDIYDLESDWSNPLTITLPKNKATNTPLFLQNLFKHFPFIVKILKQILI